MRKRLDLTGQRFGELTGLRPAENIGRRTAWVCRCDCGQETVVRTGNLRDDSITSCGCKLSTTGKLQKNDTSGAFGVVWWKARQRWRASIYFQWKWYYLGGYSKFEDAVNARKQAENDLRRCILCGLAGAWVRDTGR